MDAADIKQAALLGYSEGGTLAALFAATYPDRCRALVLYGTPVSFASWLPTEEAVAAFLDYVDQSWGTGGTVIKFAPSRANDPAYQRWWGRMERLGASPAAAKTLLRMNRQIGISDIVPTIRVPTLVIHRTGDLVVNVEAGRFLAEHIIGARYIELPGTDHQWFVGENAE
jgi:pimeloyl-ACP methyl ester carboxylesterase